MPHVHQFETRVMQYELKVTNPGHKDKIKFHWLFKMMAGYLYPWHNRRRYNDLGRCFVCRNKFKTEKLWLKGASLEVCDCHSATKLAHMCRYKRPEPNQTVIYWLD